MKVIYPGSFDPVTFGHLDVIERASGLFDQVLVAIGVNSQKNNLFSPAERIEMLEELLYDYDNVEVKTFSCLLTEFMQSEGIHTEIRGLRAVPDYEYEKQMAVLNKQLYPEMETLFMISRPDYAYISASYAREIASYGGDVSGLVPANVEMRLREKYAGH